MRTNRQSSLCSCGLPWTYKPDSDTPLCEHCDGRDCHDVMRAAHPSRVCRECVVLGVVGTPERLP